MNIWGATVCRP